MHGDHSHGTLLSAPVVSEEVFPHSNFPTYKFQLHKSLGINFTLHNMYFSLPSPSCQDGYFRVTNMWYQKTTNLSFCGIYSQIEIYSSSNKVISEVKTRPVVVVSINQISYTVLDLCQIKSSTQARHTNVLFPIWSILISLANISVNIYHIKLQPTQRIWICTKKKENIATVLFDGPGVKSPKTVISGVKQINYFSTTFQLVILSLSHRNINFQSLTISNISTVFVKSDNTRSLSLPEDEYRDLPHMHLLNIVTDKGISLNISTNHYKATGNIFVENCETSGLAFLELSDDHHNIFWECEKQVFDQQYSHECYKDTQSSYHYMHVFGRTQFLLSYSSQLLGKSVYSESNSLFVCFYFYREYSIAEANITISTTSCKVMTINFCDAGEKFTATYPDDLSVRLHWSRDRISFKASRNPCSVLQIQNWNPENRDRFVGCDWVLDAYYHNMDSARVSFLLTGILRGFLHFKPIILMSFYCFTHRKRIGSFSVHWKTESPPVQCYFSGFHSYGILTGNHFAGRSCHQEAILKPGECTLCQYGRLSYFCRGDARALCRYAISPTNMKMKKYMGMTHFHLTYTHELPVYTEHPSVVLWLDEDPHIWLTFIQRIINRDKNMTAFDRKFKHQLVPATSIPMDLKTYNFGWDRKAHSVMLFQLLTNFSAPMKVCVRFQCFDFFFSAFLWISAFGIMAGRLRHWLGLTHCIAV